MIVYGQILCTGTGICLHANEGGESKTKDFVCNAHLNFRTFSAGRKCALYKGKYSIRQSSAQGLDGCRRHKAFDTKSLKFAT